MTHKVKPVIPDDQSLDAASPTKLMVLDAPVDDLGIVSAPACLSR